MPWFEYDGLTPGGTAIAGQLEAVNHDRAREDLEAMRIAVRELRQVEAPRTSRAPVSEEDFIFFNQQLASLAEAGIALDEGMAQLARDISTPRLRRWIEELVEDLKRGVPIDQAIARRERGLPVLYSRVLRAGIDSGELPATLLNLNQHLRTTSDTRRILWELLTYPLIVLALGLSVVSLLFLAIVPQFKDIYADFGTALPGITVLLLNISEHYLEILLVGAAIIAAMALTWHGLRYTRWGMRIRESIIMATPMIGRVYRASLLSRFLRAVSTAIATGIPLPQSMRLASDATGSTTLSEDAETLADEVERGNSIFVANQTSRLIPPLFGFCVQTASGGNALPVAVSQLARSYEHRAVHSQSMLRAVLYPGLVVFLGLIIMFAVVGLFLPLVYLINSISG